MESTALKHNIREHFVKVQIDPKYEFFQEIMQGKYGLMDQLNLFLLELSHPHRDWHHVVQETSRFALDYLHEFKKHPQCVRAMRLLMDIFLEALNTEKSVNTDIKRDAADALISYLKKIVRNAADDCHRLKPLLDEVMLQVAAFAQPAFFPFLTSIYKINQFGAEMKALCEQAGFVDTGYEALNTLLFKYYQETFTYWLNEKDPETWFEGEAEGDNNSDFLYRILCPVSHSQLSQWRRQLEDTQSLPSGGIALTNALLSLPGFGDIVEHYRKIPYKFLQLEPKGRPLKVIFLFHSMNISGLSYIHGEILRDINATVGLLINTDKLFYATALMDRTFVILKKRLNQFPTTILNIILNMGKNVYATKQRELINHFIALVIKLGFQSPMIRGVDNDWQTHINTAHIQNIRVWLELISINPKLSTRLISALMIHLSLYDVFIRDTDLFPRDISRLLNSKIEPVYNLIKQLAKIFPVYFNDIGAEGALRDISTQLDEIMHRKDELVHFLRKQIHVESSSRTIAFMEAVFQYWKTGNKTALKPYLPPKTYDKLKDSGVYIDELQQIMHFFKLYEIESPADFLVRSDEELQRLIELKADVSPHERQRMFLAASLYKLLRQKYDMNCAFKIPEGFESALQHIKTGMFPRMEHLQAAMTEHDLKKKIMGLLEYLRQLKDIIVSKTQYEAQEDIYKKRHITVDIPSMYGSYHELKFDALGFTFRIESLVNVCLEDLINSIDLKLITKAAFHEIFNVLNIFHQALQVDGILSAELETQLDLLNHSLATRGFTATQFIDIFKGFARAVNNIINDYFHNVHKANLYQIIDQTGLSDILPKYLPNGQEKQRQDYTNSPVSVLEEHLTHSVGEVFFRDLLPKSLGLQQLDLFISRILKTLYQQSSKLEDRKLRLLLNYDPKQAIMSIGDQKTTEAGIIVLGNKGFNLSRLKQLGMPVPPGFIITTEVFRCHSIFDHYAPVDDNFREQVATNILEIEKLTGKTFGDVKNPLLLSVRSGASISQPGMMDTFLNVGMNEGIAEGLAHKTGNQWFAWDNYRRFIQCYGMSYGLNRDDFDAIIGDEKKRLGIAFKRYIPGPLMKELALVYKKMVMDSGITIIENTFEQLVFIIKKVMDSWESAKARTYRRIMGISDDWGTAVTVQAMIYGNISRCSGTGVFFTHNPRWSGDSLRLWGDFSIGNQGEDVVAGLVNTMPISVAQQSKEMRNTDVTLETAYPEIYKTLERWAHKVIYKMRWSPQEMEFTFESPAEKDLYLLQTRNMTIREKEKVARFDTHNIIPRHLLGNGIGVSGGAMTGRIVFSIDEIYEWRNREPWRHLILVRGDTAPDDIREINAADGLITARGGVTSHASVVAHGLGKTCVVGCGNLICNEKEKIARFNGIMLKTGAEISIDGQEGVIYNGTIQILED